MKLRHIDHLTKAHSKRIAMLAAYVSYQDTPFPSWSLFFQMVSPESFPWVLG